MVDDSKADLTFAIRQRHMFRYTLRLVNYFLYSVPKASVCGETIYVAIRLIYKVVATDHDSEH